MKVRAYIFLAGILYFFFCAQLALAQASAVIISEYSAATSPEWVELYNTTGTDITLTDWFIDDIIGGSNPKKFTLTIPANGFNFVELANVFNNSGGDSVRLLNDTQIVQDETSYTEMVENKTYSRVELTFDTTFCVTNPTKNNINEPCPIMPTLTPTATPSATPTFTPTPTLSPTAMPTPTPTPESTIENIYLSEVLPNPENGTEWVELYNKNNFSVMLEEWYIDDTENEGGAPKKIIISIAANSYAVIEFTSSLFNNAGDSVRLLNSAKKEIDSIEYTSASKDESYSRQEFTAESKWCFTSSSKNTTNNPCTTSSQAINSITSTKKIDTKPPTEDTAAEDAPKTTFSTSLSNFKGSSPSLLFFKRPKNHSVLGLNTGKKQNAPSKINYYPLVSFFAFTGVSSLAFFCYLVYRIYNEEKETFNHIISGSDA